MSLHRAAVFLFVALSIAVASLGSAAHAASVMSCTGTSGALALKASAVRGTGISPFLVFFDATGTTDSSITGNTTVFQNVTYTWDFGDTGTSGSETWAYGSNHGHNSRNNATGGIAAHLYVTPGVDTAYVATVTAHDGTNTASCQLEVIAYDPAGKNGFAGTASICVSASGTPTPGSGGCPAGAAVLHTASFNTALGSLGSGKRVLFKCGDTFSGDNAALNGTKWSVGAYGGCEGTQTHRPIFHDPNTNGALVVGYSAGDGRIADIDFEGAGTGSAAVTTLGGNSKINYQITLYNLYSNGNSGSFAWSQGAQWAIVDSVANNMRSNIAVFANYNENNPATWSGNVFNNLNYQAFLGNLFNGTGHTSTGSGQEVLRISACRMCVIENNTLENANNIGAVLKLHNGNTNNSINTWSGVYTEFVEVSDNLFTGTSGANMVEFAPQSDLADERLRNIVAERNLWNASVGAPDGRMTAVAAVNVTLRDNVWFTPSGVVNAPYYAAEIYQRGLEPVASGIEVYNNTCYWLSYQTGGTNACIGLDTLGDGKHAGINSYAKNNLFFSYHLWPTVVNNGTGNTVSNNTVTSTAHPDIADPSGTFGLISDFKPAANYSGGTTVPVRSDAIGVLWSSTWDLGALHP